MATLILPRVFLNNMASGAVVDVHAAPDRSRSVGVEGAVRTYGNGRRRGVGQVGRAEDLPLRLVNLQTAMVATLEAWTGESVMYRDDRGRRVVGVFWGFDEREYRSDKQRYDVALTLHGVSWDEAVPA